jgi:hypothetical protein
MNRKLELIIASLAVASVRIVIILDVFPLSEGQSNLIFTFDSRSRDTSSRFLSQNESSALELLFLLIECKKVFT